MRKSKKTFVMLILTLTACLALLAVCIHLTGTSEGKSDEISENQGESSSADEKIVQIDSDASSVSKQDNETADEKEKTVSEAEDDESEAFEESAKKEKYTVTITATGDCTLGKTQDQSYSDSFCDYYDSYGADYFFENVRETFESDDMTIINLECVLSTSTDRVEKTFNLKGEPEYVKIMTDSSVEACSMGNNHTYDYGEEGFNETKEVLDEAGIVYAYSDQSGMFTTDNGVKIGIVSANLLSGSEEKIKGLKSQIEVLREEGAAVIVACAHWGIEKDYYPTNEQQSMAHELIDSGADLVIGNHPHVLQGVELYKGKIICYSLGNFSFGGNKNPSDKNTMIYQQTFTVSDGEICDDQIEAKIIPCRLSSADGYNDFQPCIAKDSTKQNIIELVNTYSAPYSEIYFNDDGSLIAG